MKKVICITDSVAMPRPGLSYEETWIGRMVKHYSEYHFIHSSRRASSTARIAKFDYSGYDDPLDTLEHYEPEIAILQIGSADSAPRLIKRKSLFSFILSTLNHNIRWKIIVAYSKFFGRSIRKADLPMSHIRNNFKNYFKRANELDVKLIVVLCGKLPSWTQKKSPELKKYWGICNEIIMQEADVYDNIITMHPFSDDVDVDKLIPDDFHPMSEGQEIIFNNIKIQFDKWS